MFLIYSDMKCWSKLFHVLHEEDAIVRVSRFWGETSDKPFARAFHLSDAQISYCTRSSWQPCVRWQGTLVLWMVTLHYIKMESDKVNLDRLPLSLCLGWFWELSSREPPLCETHADLSFLYLQPQAHKPHLAEALVSVGEERWLSSWVMTQG